MFGLTINYSKSTLILMGCCKEWACEMVEMLRCRMTNLLATYLGILLGANLRRVSTWKPVVEMVEKRLATWKARTFSRARRLVLIKVVLNNLSIYYLGLFRMPMTVMRVISSCNEIFSNLVKRIVYHWWHRQLSKDLSI